MNALYRWMAATVTAGMLCVSVAAAQAQEDITTHRSCTSCGMDRKAFGYSRMLVRFVDGTEVGVCGLHCAVVEMDREPSREVAALLVADRERRSLIPAETAVWVVGGKKRGVMSKVPRWAFGTREAAEAFVKDYGGTIVPWTEVLAGMREETVRKEKPGEER